MIIIINIFVLQHVEKTGVPYVITVAIKISSVLQYFIKILIDSLLQNLVSYS